MLLTLTPPNTGPSHGAQFGAAVSSADTHLLIGAPGEANNTGEVDVFEGDPSSPSFGALLLSVPNPHAQPGARFGSSVAGMGIDLIVGAPLDSTAGPAAGSVDIFDGMSAR